ncbi:MAG: leucine-rich repeat domain-containing protein [Firmicutes bacterium]|nr:leucine-rich repeat domain-containing protein [[Eubacterium] siraeum]MCM1489006.1 leucine-rich repeat domain-containing protein [Bacillota bacterium]
MRARKITMVVLVIMALAMTACSGETQDVQAGVLTNNILKEPEGNNQITTQQSTETEKEPFLPENIPVAEESELIYRYDEELGGVLVIDYRGERTDLRIPDTLNGKPVLVVNLEECKVQLTSLVMPDSVCEFKLASDGFYKEKLKYIYIPKSVTSVYLKHCDSLTSMTIPNGVTSVEFSYCNALTSVTIPDGVTEISFFHCENLTSVTIPNSVTKIYSFAFAGCTNLTSVTIPDSVTEIGTEAFKDCENLTSVIIPYGVTAIKYAAFSNCKSLTSVTIPDSVTELGAEAFKDCESLTSLTLPDSVNRLVGYQDVYYYWYTFPKICVIKYKGKSYSYDNIYDLYEAIDIKIFH